MFHAVPMLWRLHMVHHADVDFDVTTGLRFHPVEIVLSMLIKLGVVLFLGPPVVAVLIFRSLAQRHRDVQPRERSNPRRRWTACCAGLSSRRTCIGCTTPSCGRRPTATSASTSRGGTDCSAPTHTDDDPAAGSGLVEASVEAPDGGLTIVGPFALSIGVVYENAKTGSVTGGRPLEHLEVAVGVAEGGDRPAADVRVDADWLAFFVVDEVQSQARRTRTGSLSRTSKTVLMLEPTTCSGGMP